jgi:hypothetical protein
MMKSLIVGAALALALGACATTPQPQSPPTASAKKPPAGCVGDTATRLPVRPGECAGFGSTYTKGDLDQTGQVYAQDALRLLDPAVTVHGN